MLTRLRCVLLCDQTLQVGWVRGLNSTKLLTKSVPLLLGQAAVVDESDRNLLCVLVLQAITIQAITI